MQKCYFSIFLFYNFNFDGTVAKTYCFSGNNLTVRWLLCTKSIYFPIQFPFPIQHWFASDSKDGMLFYKSNEKLLNLSWKAALNQWVCYIAKNCHNQPDSQPNLNVSKYLELCLRYLNLSSLLYDTLKPQAIQPKVNVLVSQKPVSVNDKS